MHLDYLLEHFDKKKIKIVPISFLADNKPNGTSYKNYSQLSKLSYLTVFESRYDVFSDLMQVCIRYIPNMLIPKAWGGFHKVIYALRLKFTLYAHLFSLINHHVLGPYAQLITFLPDLDALHTSGPNL